MDPEQESSEEHEPGPGPGGGVRVVAEILPIAEILLMALTHAELAMMCVVAVSHVNIIEAPSLGELMVVGGRIEAGAVLVALVSQEVSAHVLVVEALAGLQ